MILEAHSSDRALSRPRLQPLSRNEAERPYLLKVFVRKGIGRVQRHISLAFTARLWATVFETACLLADKVYRNKFLISTV